jgi:hypothetical protein
VGVQYFSQQAVGRLLAPAGIDLPADMPLPVKLEQVQKLMAAGRRARPRIYQTIGVYFGYTIATYADFYEVRNLLVLGRVLTGEGGDLILSTAQEVLRAEFPEMAERIRYHIPGEQEKRHGQAIAAASLPAFINRRHKNAISSSPTPTFSYPTTPRPTRRWPHHAPVHRRAPGRYRDHGLPRRRRMLRPPDRWFTGVVVTNGAGSPRSGIYGDYDDEMQKVRVLEQRKAAYVGEYACQIQLGFRARRSEGPEGAAVVGPGAILRAAKPEYVYLHNLADKHDTHVERRAARASRRCARCRGRTGRARSTAAKCGATSTGCRRGQAGCRPRALQHRRRAGGRFRFAGDGRQALRPGDRRPPPGPRHLLRLARHRPGIRAELRHGSDAAGGIG